MADPRPHHLSRFESRKRRRSFVLVFVALIGIGAWVGWTLSRGPVVFPAWVTDRVIQQIDDKIAQTGLSASMTSLEFHLRGGHTPVVTAQNLALKDASDTTQLLLSNLEAVTAPLSAFREETLVPVVRLSGVHLNVQRDETGALTIKLGNETLATQIRTPGDVVERLRELLSNGPLAHVSILGIEGLSITFSNDATGDVLTTRDGTLRIEKDAGDFQVALALSGMTTRDNSPGIGRVRLDLNNAAITNATSLEMSVRGFIPADIASIFGEDALSTLLHRLDAPVSLDLDAEIKAHGRFEQLAGRISVGEGHLILPEASGPAIPIDWARGEVHLNAGQDRLELRNLDVSADRLKVAGNAHLLVDRARGFSGPIVVQTALSRLQMDLPERFDAPLSFDALNADIRLRPSDNQVEISNLRARTEGTWVTAHASVSRDPEGVATWGADVAVEALSPQTVLKLWPKTYTPPTREWLTKRLLGAALHNVRAAVRKPGLDPVQLGLSFDFTDGKLAPLDWLPPITDVSGVVEISGTTLSVGIEQGQLALEAGEVIDLSGGLVRLPDLRQRNGTLEIGFDAAASVATTLQLFTLPGFRGKTPEQVLAEGAPKQMLRPEDASGEVALRTELAIPLYRSTRMKDITYEVAGDVTGFSSSALIPNRVLAADRLRMSATPAGLEIYGDARLDSNPLTAKFWRSLSRDPALRGLATVTATAPLTGTLLRDFGVPLPPNGASGQGALEITLDLKPENPPELELVGDLKGLGLQVPALSWSKPKGAEGRAGVSARLGPGGALDVIEIATSGLSLKGNARFAPGGKGVSALSLSRLEVGQWLRTSVEIAPGAGGGAGRISLNGGVLDLRKRPRGGGGGGGGSGPQFSLAMDQIILNDGITLTGVRGTLSAQGEGRLATTVNGGPAAQIDIAKTGNGPSYRIRASDAGAVIRAAKLNQNVYGGSLDLRVTPTGGTGNYNGRLRIRDTNMRNAPVMAELLSGLSIVGAIEQAAGDGIPFSDIRSDFRLTPGALMVDSASAVGASIGVSVDGKVDLGNRRLALQGVVSPVYFLNRAGSFMTRRGEGLLGMTFRLDGALDKPRLSVNPLSILAPGFLREIFREPQTPHATGSSNQ